MIAQSALVRTVYASLLCLACSGSGSGADSAAGGGPTGGGATDAGAGGTTGRSEAGCEAQRSAFAQALRLPAACEKDADCVHYQAICMQLASGNCAGIYYTSRAALETIEATKAEYEQCAGRQCNAGGVCGGGPRVPKCLDGTCN